MFGFIEVEKKWEVGSRIRKYESVVRNWDLWK